MFMNTGSADDIFSNGANRLTISGNTFSNHLGATANTYCNIRIRDPFSGAQGSGCAITGNTSEGTAAELLWMIFFDASCPNNAITGNVGPAGITAAHASNVLTGNIAA